MTRRGFWAFICGLFGVTLIPKADPATDHGLTLGPVTTIYPPDQHIWWYYDHNRPIVMWPIPETESFTVTEIDYESGTYTLEVING